jgi:citrate synthase
MVSIVHPSTLRINIDSINIDFIKLNVQNGRMTTLIGSNEAARMLGVSTSTLYAYVSRGRIERSSAPDGRTSLFALDEVEALATRSRRAAPGPRPTIDVRVSSAITRLHEGGVVVRGYDITNIVASHHFEDVAELLWSGTLAQATRWPAADRADWAALDALAELDSISRLAVAAHVLGARHPDDNAPAAARRLLRCTPSLLGSTRATGLFARRLTAAWITRPSNEAVNAIDSALCLLADHELASSTLAVRVAASVRANPYLSISAGLAVVAGPLHGRAAEQVHCFLTECAQSGVESTIAQWRAERRRIPGFGHKVYRGRDPRFDVLLQQVRQLGDLSLVDEVLAEVGRLIPKHPNIDLALGALSWRLGLPADIPLFAVARIAGWAAHHAEELDAAPVRYRGITT